MLQKFRYTDYSGGWAGSPYGGEAAAGLGGGGDGGDDGDGGDGGGWRPQRHVGQPPVFQVEDLTEDEDDAGEESIYMELKPQHMRFPYYM